MRWLTLPLILAASVATAQPYAKRDTWPQTMLASAPKDPAAVQAFWEQLDRDFPIQADWLLQDLGQRRSEWFLADADLHRQLLSSAAKELSQADRDLHARLSALLKENPPRTDPRWLTLYAELCERRRGHRLATLLAQAPRLVFTKHFNLAGSHYAYTEGQSDAQHERHFRPGASLCLLEMSGLYGAVRTLIRDPDGVIRDPDVSYDGQRVLFAWKKSDRLDDYHLYELHVPTGQVRQLTFGLGFADYEAVYLPDGDILFNSTRCVQTVDCWWTEVSNLYTCDKDGRYLRRLGFDQVHTNFPQVLDDGRVIYTRWEYNDRGQIYPQPLFQMNPDGAGQTEFYGNNSYFPTSLLHSRGIPGSHKVVSIASGHHSAQSGKLVLVDRTRGRQENEGVQLIAPVRETRADRIDAYGQDGDQWQYPHALSEREFIVTFLPLGRKKPTDRFEGRFSIFWMDADGRRELLVSDPHTSCNQPVPLRPRPRPHTRPSSVDYRKDTGVFYLQDIYRGPGLAGVSRGVVKALRVVALDYRAAGIGRNGNWGALVSTPVAIGNGSWDVKTVLGSAPVYEDGSAMFTVPARTPIYFQALDASGHVVQTMRSWATLQPGEVSSCVGCHEAKSEPPTSYERGTIALRKGAQPLQPFYGGVDGDSTRNCRVGQLRNSTDRPAPGGSRLPSGAIPVQNSPAATASPGKTDCGVGQLRNSIPPAAQGFSFPQDIQPILDRHCIRCHNDRTRKRPSATAQAADFDPESVVSLSPRESDWRYATQPPGADWAKPGFDDSKWPVGKAGFGRRGTPGGKHATDWLMPDIWLRRTFSMPAGGEAAKLFVDVCHDEDVEVYLNGVLAFRATGYITKYQTFAASAEAARALKPGENLLAVRCHQTTGGQFIDVALFAARQAEEKPSAQQTAFSLLGEPVTDAVAKRKWSDAYLALTGAVIAEKSKNEFYIADPRGALVNWVSAQSMPPMLPPYSAGAAKSGLLRMLKDGHQSVKLSREELDKLACWIDLLVPYCGDYAEAHAWTADEMAKYERFLAKRRAIEAVEARSIRELIHKQPEVGGETTLTIELTDASGAVVAKQDGRASPSKPLTFDLPRRFKAGDRIRVSGSQHLAVRLDPLLGETTVFAPDCSSVFATPLSELSCYPVGAFSGDRSRVTARPVALRELDAYRNLALNPYDVRGEAAAFPHAAANSECRNEPVFAARNAIDGHKQNQGHGKWPFQSWGPDKRADLWWQVDFGREVEMDKLVLTIRADFPHDKHWTKAAVVFSDGSRESIALQKTADPQTFRFKPRKARSVRLTDLVQDEPLGWCALVEVEVWGRDAIPVGADIARQPPK